MIKGAFIFATGLSGGIVIGAVVGASMVILAKEYDENEDLKAKLSGKPNFHQAAANVAESLQKDED